MRPPQSAQQDEKLLLRWKTVVQAAHDIRSPLAALALMEKELNVLPREAHEVVLHALTRIRSVASDILAVHAPKHAQRKASLIKTFSRISEEKFIEYRSWGNISFRKVVRLENDCLLPLAIARDLARVISNLINNAVESMPNGGEVTVRLDHFQDHIRIDICDQGCDFPFTVLKQIEEMGTISSTKEHGLGLGIQKTIDFCKMFRGSFENEPLEKGGKRVSIAIPRESLVRH